jgi:hypothetical protein
VTDTLNVGSSKAVFVSADSTNQKTVLNHGSTVYYGAQTVSSSSNDGSVADGASVTLTQAKYFISAGSSQLVVSKAASSAAYTQTYATASRTHSNLTSAAVATTAATDTAPFGYATAAQADAIVTAVNALRTDLANAKQVLNAVIDDLQSQGLLQ